jgi:hypothetical protein
VRLESKTSYCDRQLRQIEGERLELGLQNRKKRNDGADTVPLVCFKYQMSSDGDLARRTRLVSG